MTRRILFLRRTHGYGGSEVVILDLLQGIDYARNSVQLATTTDVFSTSLSRLKLPVGVVPISAAFGGYAARIFVSWLSFLLRTRPEKVILVEGGFFDFPLSAVLASYLMARGRVYLMALHPAPDPPPKASRKHWGVFQGSAFAGTG